MLSIIIGSILTILVVIFLIWYIHRTPQNLRGWYGLPLIIFVLLGLVICWSAIIIGMTH